MADVAADPNRPGVTWMWVNRVAIGVYHLRNSRNSPDPAERVEHPRHLLVFRIGADGIIDILGFIHERMLRDRALRRVVGQTGEEDAH